MTVVISVFFSFHQYYSVYNSYIPESLITTVDMLFLTSELANKAEITILSARDTTRAWVPGRGNHGYK